MLPMYHTGIIPLIYICNHGLWKGSLAPLGFWNLILVLHGSSSQWSDSWSMSGSWPKNLFTRCTCVHLCVGRKFIMQSAFLKHCCSRSLLLLFTSASLCQAITLFHTSKLFPMCTLKSSKTIVDLLVLTLRRASPFSSMNSAHSALKFVLYIRGWQLTARVPYLARQAIPSGTQKFHVLHIDFVLIQTKYYWPWLIQNTDVVGKLNDVEP